MEKMEEKGSRSPDKKKRREAQIDEKPNVMKLQLLSSFQTQSRELALSKKSEDQGVTGESSMSYHAPGGDVPIFT
jgi:hypothetical protein